MTPKSPRKIKQLLVTAWGCVPGREGAELHLFSRGRGDVVCNIVVGVRSVGCTLRPVDLISADPIYKCVLILTRLVGVVKHSTVNLKYTASAPPYVGFSHAYASPPHEFGGPQ